MSLAEYHAAAAHYHSLRPFATIDEFQRAFAALQATLPFLDDDIFVLIAAELDARMLGRLACTARRFWRKGYERDTAHPERQTSSSSALSLVEKVARRRLSVGAQSEQELLHLFRSSWLWILAEVESLMPLHFTRPSRRPRGVSLLEEINTAIQLEETAILQGEIRMLAQDPEFESLSLKGIRKKLAERLEWDAAWDGPTWVKKDSNRTGPTWIKKTVKQLVIQTMQSEEYQRREYERWPTVSAERRARARARRAVLTAATLHPAAGADPAWVQRYGSWWRSTERYSSQPLRRGTYWTNTQTGESTWENPRGHVPPAGPPAPGFVFYNAF